MKNKITIMIFSLTVSLGTFGMIAEFHDPSSKRSTSPLRKSLEESFNKKIEWGDMLVRPVKNVPDILHACIYVGDDQLVEIEPGEFWEHILAGKVVAKIVKNKISLTSSDNWSVNLGLVESPEWMINKQEFYERAEIVSKAMEQVGRSWSYDLGSHNCQHFATSCQGKLSFSFDHKARFVKGFDLQKKG